MIIGLKSIIHCFLAVLENLVVHRIRNAIYCSRSLVRSRQRSIAQGTVSATRPRQLNQKENISMKKTFITLLALAGVAVAAPQPITLKSMTTVETGNAALTWDSSELVGNELTSWEVTFNVTPTLKPGQTQIADAQIFSTTRKGQESKGVQFSSNNNGTVKIHGDGIATQTSTSTCLTIGTKTPITIRFVADYKGNTYTGGTFTVLSGETEYLNFTVAETIADTKLISGTSSVWTQSGSGASTIFKISDVAVTKLDDNYKAVPEPATATLSLLALAGLAMRRRRK